MMLRFFTLYLITPHYRKKKFSQREKGLNEQKKLNRMRTFHEKQINAQTQTSHHEISEEKF
jgi:hypothetical protein